MRLDEHEDFVSFVTATTGYLRDSGQPKISEAIVEKDYYVTEVLRKCAEHLPQDVIFKGGTSLSKGFKLIRRFSEDVDLYVAPVQANGTASPNQTKQRMKRLAALVAEHPALTLGTEKSMSHSRASTYTYQPQLPPGALATSVLLESGITSGDFPTERMPLNSYVAEYLIANAKPEDLAQFNNTKPFDFTLMSYSRTFVEKLYTIHSKVENWDGAEGGLDRYPRHYYDIGMLLNTEGVRELLNGNQIDLIRKDYRQITQRHFPNAALPPGMRLNNSRALYPDTELKTKLETEYVRECKQLCFHDDFPSLSAVLAGLEDIRQFL